jgi:hypothetical protein
MRAKHSTYFVLATTILLFLVLSGAHAQDASKEQCTCDLTGFPDRTGAQVVNAASCVLELRHPWCDIFLASIEGSEEHTTAISEIDDASSGDVASIQELILEMFDRYLASIPARAAEMADTFGSDRNAIEESAQEKSEILLECAKSFSSRSAVAAGEGKVTCSVGEQSGWLRIRFDLGERAYLFLFAPEA